MRALYATGGHVFGTVRNVEKGQKAVDDVKSRTKSGGKITLIEMDMESLASVRTAAESFLKQSKQLNILINNAGVMATPEGKTKDGFETQFGVNHLAHFLFFQLLKPTLLASSSADFPSRVVSVSSFGHRYGEVRFHDYNFTEEDSYNPSLSYGQSKTANIWLANEIEVCRTNPSISLLHTNVAYSAATAPKTCTPPPCIQAASSRASRSTCRT